MTREIAFKARYVMVGGFLGAGKTTAIERFARHLTDRGHRVGLITNDQSSGLVDTALLRARGFAVEEISGGCFCCRFASLQEAADRLTQTSRPDVFLAEPVGSCTDLVATVSYPLRRLYGKDFVVAPLSVMVDPVRAGRVLGLLEGRAFSEKVAYIYRKQLEEAQHLVINKCDLIDAAYRSELEAALIEASPGSVVHHCSATQASGLAGWFEAVLADERAPGATMSLDYDLYADGEALLGWLNATLSVASSAPFDANELLGSLAEELRLALDARSIEAAHVKMTFDPHNEIGSLAAVSFVRSDAAPHLRESLDAPSTGGELILNVRAEAEPAVLLEQVDAALAGLTTKHPALRLTREHQESFRPGRPTPTHRIQVASSDG